MRTDIEFSIVAGADEEMLFACLESLHAEMRSNTSLRWSVTVMCSAEAEKLLAARVQVRYPSTRIIETFLPRNSLCSHSQVLRNSQARYIWLLNDHVVFLNDTVATVTAFMERPENSRVAIVGPQLLDPDGRAVRSGYGFPSMRGILLEHAGAGRLAEDDPGKRHTPAFAAVPTPSPRLRFSGGSREVDTLPDACIALKSNAVRQTGLMLDEAVPRAARIEWHRRFSQNGWNIILLADASVIHYGGRSSSAGLRGRHREHLQESLHFFQTGSPPVVFRMFCALLLSLFCARALFLWLSRDSAALGAERSLSQLAWLGLTGRGAAKPGGHHATDAGQAPALHLGE